jgi:hypothetical protein
VSAPDRPSLILADKRCNRITLDKITTRSAHIMEHDISQLDRSEPVRVKEEELGCYSNSIREKPCPDTIAENTGEVKLMMGMPVSS